MLAAGGSENGFAMLQHGRIFLHTEDEAFMGRFQDRPDDFVMYFQVFPHLQLVGLIPFNQLDPERPQSLYVRIHDESGGE